MNYINQISSGRIILNDVESKISILITGDLCLVNRVKNYCSEENASKIYGNYLKELKDKDFSITNLECPITDSNEPIQKSGPTIKAGSQCSKIVKAGNFDLVTLANNHIMDYGEKGLNETIENCKKEGIDYVGVGKNIEEANKVFYKIIKNKTIAIINIAEHEFSIAEEGKAGASPIDIIDNYKSIKEAQENSDFVFVIVHGGNENYKLPSPRVKKLFHFFADAGASAVIGHHSHVSSGVEIYKGVPLVYSLGNFIFDDTDLNLNYFKSYFIKIELGEERVKNLNLYPYYQFQNIDGLERMKEPEEKSFLESIKNLSLIIKDDTLLNEEWNKFTSINKNAYLAKLLLLKPGFRFLFKSNKTFRNYMLNKRKKNLLLNLFQCEAHNESVTNILKNLK